MKVGLIEKTYNKLAATGKTQFSIMKTTKVLKHNQVLETSYEISYTYLKGKMKKSLVTFAFITVWSVMLLSKKASNVFWRNFYDYY